MQEVPGGFLLEQMDGQVARSRRWAAGPAQRKGRPGSLPPCPGVSPWNHPRSRCSRWPRAIRDRKEVLGEKTDKLQRTRRPDCLPAGVGSPVRRAHSLGGRGRDGPPQGLPPDTSRASPGG